MSNPKPPTMTSREAAALLVSGGTTTDADYANLMAEGKALDPDKLQRAHFRRAIGFDFTVNTYPVSHYFTVTDDETKNVIKGVWLDDDDKGNATRMSKACIKLKKQHDVIEVEA